MMERNTVRKWWWIWNFDKEEQRLNAMAQSGWALNDVSFCTYRFTHCESGAYASRPEMHLKEDAYFHSCRRQARDTTDVWLNRKGLPLGETTPSYYCFLTVG